VKPQGFHINQEKEGVEIMYLNETVFNEDDFNMGQIIKLTINSNDYLLSSSDRLVNLRTGQEIRKLQFVIPYVKAVYANLEKSKQLAVRIDNKLYKYDPFVHNENLAIFKRTNNLLTGREVSIRLRKEKLYLNVSNLLYRKKRSEKFFEGKVLRSYNVMYAQETLKKRRYRTTNVEEGKVPQYVDSQIVPLNCLIDRIEIDKAQELYLYRYQLTPCIV